MDGKVDYVVVKDGDVENRYVIPFLAVRLGVSVPMNAQQVDLTPAEYRAEALLHSL